MYTYNIQHTLVLRVDNDASTDNFGIVDNGNPFGIESKYLYLIILTSLILGLIASTSLMTCLFYAGAIHASERLHNKMFWKILRSPVRFYDYNPVGIVLTRFSKDLGVVDEFLPSTMLTVNVVRIQFWISCFSHNRQPLYF